MLHLKSENLIRQASRVLKIVVRMGAGQKSGLDWIAAVSLFAATAGVVLWQNSRLSVLWDLSYALDSAVRIAFGQIPYRDFPFVHPPLTFLIQAAIIKVAGRVYWHHIAYCALISGLSTVAAWRIVFNVLRGRLAHPRLIAFLLSLPLIPLGVYSVLPQPFYDPDCAAAILGSLVLLQGLDIQPSSKIRAFTAGATLAIPVFVKQNIGLAFLAAAGFALALLAVIEISQGRSVRRYVYCFAGMAFAIIAALLCLQFMAGLDNYWHWTIQFAAARRLPASADMLEIYEDKNLIVWLGLFVLGAGLMRFNRGRRRWLDVVCATAMSAPFIWAALSLLLDSDLSDRTDALLGVWPFALIVALISPAYLGKTSARFSQILPVLLIAAAQGTFMSQQLWGSTYAIWPFLIILIACTLSALVAFSNTPSPWAPATLAFLVSTSLLIAGSSYVLAHERLNYAQIDDGPLYRATMPQLRGLSLRGQQLPDFEELLRYTETNIPRDDGVVVIPGEDPFFFATGRRPKFPVLLFDHTTDPFSVEQLVQLCRERKIRWLIVKEKLQNKEDPVEHRDQLMVSLMHIYAPAAHLHNYAVYRLRPF